MHDAQEESRGSRDGYTGFYKPLRIVARFGPCYFDYLCIGERRYMSFQVPNKAWKSNLRTQVYCHGTPLCAGVAAHGTTRNVDQWTTCVGLFLVMLCFNVRMSVLLHTQSPSWRMSMFHVCINQFIKREMLQFPCSSKLHATIPHHFANDVPSVKKSLLEGTLAFFLSWLLAPGSPIIFFLSFLASFSLFLSFL